MGLSFLKHNLAVPHPRILQKVEWSPSEAAAEYKDLQWRSCYNPGFSQSVSLCCTSLKQQSSRFSECSLEGVLSGGQATQGTGICKRQPPPIFAGRELPLCGSQRMNWINPNNLFQLRVKLRG